MSEPSIQPPASIKRAIYCIWASFVTTVLSWVSLFFTTIPEHIAHMARQMKVSVHTLVVIKLCGLSVSAIIVYLILRQVAKGRNWARIICLIMGVIALPDALYRFTGYHNPTDQTISLVINAIYLGFGYYALYLMFTTPGKEWFRKSQSIAAS